MNDRYVLLNDDDLSLIEAALDKMADRGVLDSLIAEPEKLAIDQRIEQIKKKFSKNEEKETDKRP